MVFEGKCEFRLGKKYHSFLAHPPTFEVLPDSGDMLVVVESQMALEGMESDCERRRRDCA